MENIVITGTLKSEGVYRIAKELRKRETVAFSY